VTSADRAGAEQSKANRIRDVLFIKQPIKKGAEAPLKLTLEILSS
jgi:hypothetical protein